MRFLRFLLTGVLLAIPVSAQTIPNPLTADDAVRIAGGSQRVVALGRAQLDLARSEVERQRRWPNPTLEYTREDAGGAEHYPTLSQSFDVSGRRALRRRAAELRAEASQQDVTAQQIELARVVRSEFNRAANRQELVRALTAWANKIRAAVETAARLQEGGEVSGYDRRRLEREQIGSEARLAAERGALLAAQRRLASLLGVEQLDGVTLQRDPLPDIPADAGLSNVVQNRPDITALTRRIEAATLDRQAAQRWRMPVFELTAGWKKTETADGTTAAAAVSLPLFNRNQDELMRTSAEVAILESQRAILIAHARGEAGALAAEARELRNAARIFREKALPTSARLTATAEAAYRAGEVGILELLDAYRTALDAELEAADLEQRAREADIELTRALGGIAR